MLEENKSNRNSKQDKNINNRRLISEDKYQEIIVRKIVKVSLR